MKRVALLALLLAGCMSAPTPARAHLDLDVSSFLAAHEVAHVKLHGRLLCDAARIPGALIYSRARMDQEADRCALLLLAGGTC